MNDAVQSWNRIPRVRHAHVVDFASRHDTLPSFSDVDHGIAHGNGRSYGDVCLDPGGIAFRTRRLDHFIAFDRTIGRLTCEAGVLLSDILDLIVPQGWFLPVTPGTRFVTVGGAVANDVHGKNHHVAGSFGHHVLALELLRSDGERIVCGPDRNREWFAATVGGLGLTGIITWVELALSPVANAFMITASHRFRSLREFWHLSADAEQHWPYTVAWIDCLSKRGRGVLHLGRHAPSRADLPSWRESSHSIPILPPFSLVTRTSLRAFNALYYHRTPHGGSKLVHHRPFFYPLDAIRNWNRIYGPRGFYQYQCVLPPAAAPDGIAEMLRCIAGSHTGSFLAVLKTFGARPSVGMLSFPRSGTTLALDFPDRRQATQALFEQLDAIVDEAGGALYPAKDARMSARLFRRGFPSWEPFVKFVDRSMSSGFWRRVMER
jgi:FAD/FMN-containing dehydrogenase